jgi:hypothetical protein
LEPFLERTETTNPDALSAAPTKLRLTDNVEIVLKSDDRNALLHHFVHAAEAINNSACDHIISGRSATVNAACRGLRRWPHRTSRIKARAYWANGRTGLS